MTDRRSTPRDRQHFPYLGEPTDGLKQRFEEAIATEDLETASFAFLELRHLRPKSAWVRHALARFEAIGKQPVEWLGVAHAVASGFKACGKGDGNVYLVLLDTRDHKARDWGVYVGQTTKEPDVRYAQHRAGVRASGDVRRRGVGLLKTAAFRLWGIKRAEARRIEVELANELKAKRLVVRGGH
jgi:hypothetical protein